MNLDPPHEHELLVFWVGLFVIVVLARTLGAVARRCGQPAVIGELAAGIFLGPSLLGRVAPDVFDWLFPPDRVQTAMLFTVGWLGVVFLLVVTGYETDLGLIQRLGRAAGIVSAGSLIVPMLAGLATGFVMPTMFIGDSGDRTVFALFLAAALSISSLPVIAKILGDMGFMRRDFGQLTLAAGMANDVVGWIMLGIVAGLAAAGDIELGAVLTTIGGLAAFFAVAFTLGQMAFDGLMRRIRLGNPPAYAATAVIVAFALAFGSFTQWLGVEAVLGAFVAGVLVGRSRLRSHAAIEPIESVTTVFLAPVFFATAGLRVDLGLLADAEVMLWAVIVVIVASLGKFLGSVIAARIAGLPNREGAALGFGLNARGALEIVIATVGLSLGVLNQTSYTVVVLMALATSMAAPPLLRRVLAGWEGTPDEQRRLKLEERLAGNRLIRNDRVMLATRGGPDSIMAAQLVDLAWPKETPVGLVSVGDDTDDVGIGVLRDVLWDRQVEHRHLDGAVVDAIIEELRLGYGVAVIGTSVTRGSDHVLSPAAEHLAQHNQRPTIIVRRGLDVVGRLPGAYQRVLLPVSGTPSSQAALEFALNISANIGTEAVLAHIVPDEAGAQPVLGRPTDMLGRNGSQSTGRRLLDDALDQAADVGARAVPVMITAESTSAGIVEAAAVHQTDLVVVGATRRDIDGQLFLGHTVERLVRDLTATLVVVVTPPDHQPERSES